MKLIAKIEEKTQNVVRINQIVAYFGGKDTRGSSTPSFVTKTRFSIDNFSKTWKRNIAKNPRITADTSAHKEGMEGHQYISGTE